MELLSERIKHNMSRFEGIMINPAAMSSVFGTGSGSLANAAFHCMEALPGEYCATSLKLSLSKNEHPSRQGAAWVYFPYTYGRESKERGPLSNLCCGEGPGYCICYHYRYGNGSFSWLFKCLMKGRRYWGAGGVLKKLGGIEPS